MICRLIIIYLLLVVPAHAGYEIRINPQLQQYIWVSSPTGPEQRINPLGKVVPVGLYCRPADYTPFAPEPARRSEVVTSATGTAAPAEVLAVCPTVLDAKYQRLWDAASNWEKRNISGAALSLLTLGVIQGKPKSLAIAQWSSNLWNGLYYPRKALISLAAEPDCDFSPAGDMPYSVPELSIEVWGQ